MRIQIELGIDEYRRLQNVAEREHRPLKYQASWLLTRALEDEGQKSQDRDGETEAEAASSQ